MNGELSRLELAGFQVFEELTRIPIKRITLLFGPNSAGKSAVEDALVLGAELLRKNSFDSFSPFDRFEKLRRNWRRTGNAEHPYSQSLRLNLGIKNKIQVGFSFNLHDVRNEPGMATDFSCSRNIEIQINEEPAVSLIEFEKLGVNFSHPSIANIPLTCDLSEIAEKFPDIISIEDGWVWIRGQMVRINEEKKFDDVMYKYDVEREKGEGYVIPELAFQAVQEISQIFDRIVEDVFGRKWGQHIPVVPASRRIPSEQDLTFILSSESSFGRQDEQPLKSFGISSPGAPEYFRLAESFASPLFPDSSNRYGLWDTRESDGELSQSVNHMLREHLFSEKGYRIDFDYRCILNPAQYLEIKEGFLSETDVKEFVGLVRLFLVDSHGREYSFSEVGSGLGYVLPVLCALSNDIALIQQPELHLHPALQAALGDVFIESTHRKNEENNQKKLMIETHSEYILLRVLRRIKQSYEKRVPPELFIEPDDVAVLYFDPMPDDTTRVTELRVTHVGEPPVSG